MAADPFLDQLADLCRSERTRAKWLFVPSHAVGHTLGDRLARDATNWANLRLVTPLDVAIRMAAPFLLEQGIDPSEEPLGPPLVMRLLLELPEEDGYFRAMAEQAALADALWRTLRELRYAGLRARDLVAGTLVVRAKQRELVALVSAYERYLATARVADMPVVFEQAVHHLDWCPIAPGDLVLELPETIWPPVVRRFLDVVPGERVRARTLALPAVSLPPRAQGLVSPADPVAPAAGHDAARLRFLQVPGEAGAARRDGSLDLFHAGGREAEVEEVCRRILASGRPLDEVEVACASSDYERLFWEKARRLGWDVTVSSGVPAAATRPGRLLRQFCDWIAADVAASALRALLHSGDCAPRVLDALATEDEGRVTPGQAARLLLKAGASWGRATYQRALTRLAREYDEQAADTEQTPAQQAWSRRKGMQVRTVAAWVEGVLDTLPEPGADGRVPVAALAGAAKAFLEQNAARSSALDAVAHVAVMDALGDLRALGDSRSRIETGLTLLGASLDAVTVMRDRPRPGHLHISTLAEAGFDRRPLVFVVGLQEGGVFRTAVEDPVLLDVERSRISPLLATAADRLDEGVFKILARLAALGVSADEVCLSFSCRDTREFRETFPSWLVLQAFRLREGEASRSYDDLARALAEPVSVVPSRPAGATSDAGWWLASPAAPAATRDAVLEAFPSLARGGEAEAARSSTAFTKFDGYVPAAGEVLDPTRNGRHTSASALESAASCPYSFFLEQGLGVRPLEEEVAEEEAWLSALVRGGELHALYARFMRHVRDAGRRPELGDWELLQKWGVQRLDELRAGMPPPSAEVFDREGGEFLDDLRAFLDAECDGRHGEHPEAFEVPFGMRDAGTMGEPLAHEMPLVVDVGDGRALSIRGRIDRINRLARGQYEVVDYKTGGFWADRWRGVFAGGTRLQPALYLRAVDHLLGRHGRKGAASRFRYLFPAVKGHRQQKAIERAAIETLPEVLRDLVDVIGSGTFAVAEDKDKCRFCEYAAACHAEDPAAGNDPHTRAARKVLDPGNSMLDPYRRLRGHD